MRYASIVLALAALALTGTSAMAQESERPGWNGVWLTGGGSQGFPQSQWSAGELPFTEQGRARFEANIPGKGPRQTFPALGNDPLGDANPPGLYRTLVYGRPFEWIQLDDKVVQIFEWGKKWRTIWTDGRDEIPLLVDAMGPYWYGYSYGRWEGDTLIVETVALDGRQWFDEWGTPITDHTRVVEHWRQVDDGTLELVLTVEDPELYGEPWQSSPRAYRRQSPDSLNGEVTEQLFAPIDEAEFNQRVRDPAAGVGVN